MATLTDEIVFEGKVGFITPAKDVSKKANPFIVSSIGIDLTIVVGGKPYPNYVIAQATGDMAEKIQSLNIGDKIHAFLSITGSAKVNTDIEPTEKNPESLGGFNNINLYRFELIEKAPEKVKEDSPQNSSTPEYKQSPENVDDLPF